MSQIGEEKMTTLQTHDVETTLNQIVSLNQYLHKVLKQYNQHWDVTHITELMLH